LILADRRRVKQIVINLVSNAVKFSPNGGVVTIAVGEATQARAADAMPGFGAGMRMSLPPGANFQRFVELSVTDGGIGIAADDLHRLFTPFSQVASALTHNSEGTGLGLLMVHRLAELHGGAVAVTSEPSMVDSQLGPRKWMAVCGLRGRVVVRPTSAAAGSTKAQAPAVHWYTCTPWAANSAIATLPSGTAMAGGTLLATAKLVSSAVVAACDPLPPTTAATAPSVTHAAARIERLSIFGRVISGLLIGSGFVRSA
jgi:signal transduction histidine kinase